MKTISITFFAFLLAFSINVNASVCDLTKTNGGGFTTTLESVVNNCNSTYTITMLVTHNGEIANLKTPQQSHPATIGLFHPSHF